MGRKPFEFRQPNDSEDPKSEVCTVCGSDFDHRRASNKYCETCGEDRARWRRDQNARQAVHRLLVRREFLGILTPALVDGELGIRRTARWAQREQTDNQLAELERLLVQEGTHNPKIRSRLRTKAALLAQTIDPSEHNQAARAWGLLSEVGVEAGENPTSSRLYAAKALSHYLAISRKDRDGSHHARFARALLRLSSQYRDDGDNRVAGQTANAAYYVLKEKSDPRDPRVKQLLHQADLRSIRLLASGLGETELVRRQRDEMIRLAGEINIPAFWLDTARELAGYWGERDPWRAKEQIVIISKLQAQTPNRPIDLDPTFLRPHVELLLAADGRQKQEDGIRLIVEDYIALYRRHPHGHYADVLRRWCNRPNCSKLGLPDQLNKLRLPRPTYNNSLMFSLPRGF
jgi:hypothetical protein